MKITTKTLKFVEYYTLEEFFSMIFQPHLDVQVADIIKLLRRYRHYIVALQYMGDKTFAFSFSFPKREILENFRIEYEKTMQNNAK